MFSQKYPAVVSHQISASSLQAGINEKPQSQRESLLYHPSPGINPENALEAKAAVRDAYLKRTVRILKVITRVIALIIAIATGTQETITMQAYLKTHKTIRGGRGPWAIETSLWPTIMLLSVSFLTIVLSFLTILAYIRQGVKAANKAHRFALAFEIAVEGGHVLVWIVVAVLYRVGKTGHDLWGWACSPVAQRIQPNFEGVVDFKSVCKRGGKSWVLSMLSAAFQGLTCLTILLALERRKHKRRLAVAQEENMMLRR